MIVEPRRKIIVGLGNPSKEYLETRHNIGRLVVQAFALKDGLSFVSERSCDALIAKGCVGVQEVVFGYPTCFMNESGRSVRRLVQFFDVATEDLLVIADDIDTTWAKMNVVFSGGARGHNGIRSIHSELKTKDFFQLRVGVGRPDHGSVADFVLQQFRADERQALPEIMDEACSVVQEWISR